MACPGSLAAAWRGPGRRGGARGEEERSCKAGQRRDRAAVRHWTAAASTRQGTTACELVIFGTAPAKRRGRGRGAGRGLRGGVFDHGNAKWFGAHEPSAVARGWAGTRHGRDSASARCWRVSRSWDRGLTRLGRPHARLGRGGAVRRQGAWRTCAQVRRQPAANGCFNFICPTSK
jgi:hypothetical protein